MTLELKGASYKLEAVSSSESDKNYAKIKQDFAGNHLVLEQVHRIRNEKLETRFKNARREMEEQNSVVTVMAYHGTATKNIESISRVGLLVPGKGNSLQVAHGTALGLGIYLAISPGTSAGYATKHMFLCCALLGNRFVIANTGQVLVITNAAQVLPMYLITFRHQVAATYAPTINKTVVPPPPALLPNQNRTQKALKKLDRRMKKYKEGLKKKGLTK